MTLEEYQERKKVIDNKYEQEVQELKIEFALKNNIYKVGDIIQDHYHIIKIEKWQVAIDYLHKEPAFLMYRGIQLNKNLEPLKRQKNPDMYQNNIIKKLN
jgi:hypothetical protein